MTISKKQLQEACQEAYEHGKYQGREEQKKVENQSLSDIRRKNILDVAESAALLAKANASMTYSLSRLMDQMK